MLSTEKREIFSYIKNVNRLKLRARTIGENLWFFRQRTPSDVSLMRTGGTVARGLSSLLTFTDNAALSCYSENAEVNVSYEKPATFHWGQTP